MLLRSRDLLACVPPSTDTDDQVHFCGGAWSIHPDGGFDDADEMDEPRAALPGPNAEFAHRARRPLRRRARVRGALVAASQVVAHDPLAHHAGK